MKIDPVSLAITGLNTIASARQAKAAAKAQAAEMEFQRQQILEKRKIEERRAREAVKRELAAKRARFGASGASGGGSANAVLAGLRSESERRLAESRFLEDMSLSQLQRRPSKRSLLDDGLGLAAGLLSAVEVEPIPLFEKETPRLPAHAGQVARRKFAQRIGSR